MNDKIGEIEECFKACGINPNKAAASRTPVAYEIRQGIRIFWTPFGNMRKVAAVMMAPILPKTLNNIIQIINNLTFSRCLFYLDQVF